MPYRSQPRVSLTATLIVFSLFTFLSFQGQSNVYANPLENLEAFEDAELIDYFSKTRLLQEEEDIVYQMSNDYSDYIFEGISEYEVFQTGLNKVQMLEQFMQICRDRMLSGFYDG